ncbi:hypothetical protein Acsp03_34710 [Actinomadura sp. NBRC 104412]|uniref:ATP-binding protein n=1 Tax=Actinomadura sp. NBRC 104412 TaxID=3032203 RepID=UPI0024A0B7E0|nr:ATP-binding protein [Actinomadura sp. NBRC 104412]GLZ06005.1 hypothetical protein Acsp03_34710 [Actinomadura sp. NBRC 104412]
MTSRQAQNGTRWEVASVAEPSGPLDRAAEPGTAEPEPVPEACDLPPRLKDALWALVNLSAPTVSFSVLPEPESVTEARHFAISRLKGWGACALTSDVGLVVSELVTNALRHSTAPTVWDAPAYATRHAPGLGHGTGFAGGCFATGGLATRFGTELEAGPAGPMPGGIRLRMLYHAPWLLCGIMDSSPEAPRRREPDHIAETGRGLHLVESFSTRWGWCGLPQGKVVWALFRSP